MAQSPEELEITERRRDLILEAHMHARMTHLIQEHVAKVAERLGLDPRRIEGAGGGASIGERDSAQIRRHWFEGTALCRLTTFRVDAQDIITFEKADISKTGLDVIYNVRVLTGNADTGIELNLPI